MAPIILPVCATACLREQRVGQSGGSCLLRPAGTVASLPQLRAALPLENIVEEASNGKDRLASCEPVNP